MKANEPAEEEEGGDRDQVQQRDALVVFRQQPRRETVAVVDVIQGRHVLLHRRASARLRHRRRCRTRARSCPLLAQRLHVGDQLQQLFLADQALEGRHDRLEPGDDLGLRIDDRLADVRLVRGHDLAVLELHRLAEHVGQYRTASLGLGEVAGVARQVLKELRAGGNRRVIGAAAAQPRLKVRRVHRDDAADHAASASCRNTRRRTGDRRLAWWP